MHELSIAISIIDTVCDEVTSRRLSNVKRVHLKLGALSGVVSGSLVSAFEIARESTLIANAELVIEETPIVIYCPSCDAKSTADTAQYLCCCRCGTLAQDVLSGREMDIIALEVEQ